MIFSNRPGVRALPAECGSERPASAHGICPRCGFALIAYMGHDTCPMGCGWDGDTRAPTAEERGTHRTREPQFRGWRSDEYR